MATVHTDHVSLLESEEEDGVIVSLVRRFRVTGVTDTDYDAIGSALTASGVPVYDDQLAESRYANIAVRRRVVRFVDNGTFDVDVFYEKYENRLDSLQLDTILVEFSGAVQQVTSNLDRDDQIQEVSHTWPADDPDASYASQTLTQGGEFTFLQAQKTVRVRGRKQASRIWLLVNGMVGKINSVAFVGGAVDTWLCTRVDARPADVSGTPIYDFEAEFQYNPDGWQPQIIYRDPRTGAPPPDLVANTGYKTVNKYEEADFESFLGARIFGG